MEKKKVKKDEPVLDFGLSFGGILTELGNLTQDVTRIVAEGQTEMHKAGEISFDRSRKMKGMYGVTVRMGGDGMPKVETFGRRPESDIREPIIDVFDEAERVQVIVELPGVEEPDIRVTLDETTLRIQAGKGERKYRKEIDLGLPIKGEPKTQYKNEVLEINLDKA